MRYNDCMAELLGFNVNEFTFDEAVAFAKGHHGQVVTINPEMIEYATNHPDFADIIRQAELVIPDGIGVEIGLKILGHNVRRIAGINFARRMLDEFKGQRIALVGAKPYVIERVVENLKAEGIEISYYRDGYFKNDEDVLSEVVNANPQLLLVALGSPAQEEFIYKLKSKLPNTLMVGVGGSFDVWAGEVERAPEIYQKLGIEWLYRTVKEPKRFKRIFPTLPLFMFRVINYGVKNAITKRN